MKRRQFTKTLAAIPLLGVVPFVKAQPLNKITWVEAPALVPIREVFLPPGTRMTATEVKGCTEAFIRQYEKQVLAVFEKSGSYLREFQ